MIDQVSRAVDTGRLDRALDLSEGLFRINPAPYPAALYAESLRLAGRRELLSAFVRSLPRAFFSSPRMAVVMALEARDRDDEAQARRLLQSALAAHPRPPVRRALESPMSTWPSDLRGMWGLDRAADVLVLPDEAPPPDRP
jgi:hypothetical protein